MFMHIREHLVETIFFNELYGSALLIKSSEAINENKVYRVMAQPPTFCLPQARQLSL